jgi:hypothetical protein
MRTNENQRSTADDGITLCVFMPELHLAEISAAKLESFDKKCVAQNKSEPDI